MRKTDNRTRRGAALIIAIAVMTVLLAIGLTFFTVARVESTTAMNVVNTVRAEHLVDAGFAIAQYQLNRDLQDHPQATSLDHGWRTMFNGAAFAGKNWATANGDGNPANGTPGFNLERVERALRAAGTLSVPFSNSLLYVIFPADGYTEPLFRGPVTAPWLAIPRWQGNDILLYRSEAEMRLCNNLGDVIPDSEVNTIIGPNRIVRFDMAANGAAYPFVTTAFYGLVPPLFGAEPLWAPEQIDRLSDFDTNGDGMRDSLWVPLPKDVDLSRDGIDNDLDGTADTQLLDTAGSIAMDEDGNPRYDFEIGAFVYRVDSAGKIVRTPDELADALASGGVRPVLTMPLPGLRIPLDLNNDGKIDSLDYYVDPGTGVNGPVYVLLPGQVNVPGVANPLTIADVDALDNDYDLFVNGFSAYAFLGDPRITARDATYAQFDQAFVAPIAGNFTPADFSAARTRYASKIIHWADDTANNIPGVMPNIAFSNNAPAWLRSAPLPPVVISLTGEPVCDVIGRAAIHVVDEASKVNMNAAGGHRYRDDLDINANPTAGQHIARALNQGVSTHEYETRALPWMGVRRSADLWGALTGAGWMVDPPAGTQWDYSTLLPYPGARLIDAIPDTLEEPFGPLQPYAYDISLPGYGRIDDNMNALLLAFNGRADAGNKYADQGLYLPPLSALTGSLLDGLDVTTLTDPQKELVKFELPAFVAYFNLLGMFEGIDEPGELQPAAPLRNRFAEGLEPSTDTGNLDQVDNNNDGVVNDIGEAGDRVLANNYELQKAAEQSGRMFGDERWPDVKNVVTANSDSRNVNYVTTPVGQRAVTKIDPNLATPAQLAAGLLAKGDIRPVTAPPLRVSLTAASDPLYFAEGLRQADTTLTDYLFDQSGARFAADPVLQALQTAVNIADSRDADPARSLLVTDKRVTAAYESFYRAEEPGTPFTPQPPPEPLNERERVPQADAFPVGELQDYLINALGAPIARRTVAVDKWWQNLTDAVDPAPSVIGDREHRVISYAAAGADAVRINELMVRPVRRVEAEAVTHAVFNLQNDNPDLGATRFPLSVIRADGATGVTFAQDYLNLDPTPYAGMPVFDLQAIPQIEDTSGASAWTVRSPYDQNTPWPGNFLGIPLGDETAYVYNRTDDPGWTLANDNTPVNANNDIVEFRVKATDGLPPGRYYLTVNVIDPLTGTMTVDDVDQLEYSVKHITTNVAPPSLPEPGIRDDIAYVLSLPDTSPPPGSVDLSDDKQELLFDYYASFWLPVDDMAYVANQTKLDNGSAEPLGWVFCRSELPASTIALAEYTDIRDYLGLDPGDPTGTQYLLDNRLQGYTQSYFRDSVRAGSVDAPAAGIKTFTVIVPPNDGSAPYDTLCIAFRLKPLTKNLLDPNRTAGPTTPRRLALNFLDFSQQPDHEYVELVNTTDTPIDLDGWTLEVGIPDPAGIDDDPTMRDPFKSRWTVPPNTVIAPKGYLLLGFDKFDQFQNAAGATDPGIPFNGMGLAAGSASPAQSYVTAPPMAGGVTGPQTFGISPYYPLDDLTASVFRRELSAAGGSSDYIDTDGDGVSSAPYVYGYLDGSGNVLYNFDRDTDGVAVEAKYHGNANGVVPPFARIVQLEPKELWWDNPYQSNTALVTAADITTVERIAELVLRGGFLPDYPEHDGHDNDGDGGFVITDKTGEVLNGDPSIPLLRYVRGTLDKDMVDNDLDERIDENGKEVLFGNTYTAPGRPLLSEGVDEGRIGESLLGFTPLYRPRFYGYGSFEEGDSNISFVRNAAPYLTWVSNLELVGTFYAEWSPGNPVLASDGFPYTHPSFSVNPVSGPMPVVAATSSPEWTAFCERRWNPGDNVIVTLYVGPSAERKVADRATYRELDVTNRAVDDIQESRYYIDGYRNFSINGTTGALQWDGPLASDPDANRVCLDRNRKHYWLPNQMGLDFYRSLERKHPLYAGDKFGLSNRWEATDGSYDDWADSLSPFEAEEHIDQPVGAWYTNLLLHDSMPGTPRLFGHAMAGSPLRMNTQQRLWDNPPDLVALLSDTGGMIDPEGLTAGSPSLVSLDGGRHRQFVESDQVNTGAGAFENRAYSLRRAEVRNRPFNSVGDLMKLPMVAFETPLSTGLTETTSNGSYTWRSTNAALNTRWLPVVADPLPNNSPAAWRQDRTLRQSLLANAPDKDFTLPGTPPTGTGFAALSELNDISPVTLTVGQARFRPIWPNPSDPHRVVPAGFDPETHLHWQIGAGRVAAPHCWAPVMLLAGTPPTPTWSTFPRWSLPYPPPLPVAVLPGGGAPPRWPAPAAWFQWLPATVDTPYLIQSDFLRDPNRRYPVFGDPGAAMTIGEIDDRWPRTRLYPPQNSMSPPPLEQVEYPRAVMFVSQHDDSLGDAGRAEGVFSWDAADGLENGTYIAYVATFVPRMGQRLLEADTRVLQLIGSGATISNASQYATSIIPQLPTGNPPAVGTRDPLVETLCNLDPTLPHAVGTDRFDPVLALEFVTDPTVADRVAPPHSVYPPNPASPLAALPHPADWFPDTVLPDLRVVPSAAAYRPDGDGMILYSGSGQVTWRAKLVRVTDRFLALRVRNMGEASQVACITGVILAPARHVPGRINVNTVENTRVISAVNTTAETYTFGLFNTLLGLPGVVDALESTNNPDPAVNFPRYRPSAVAELGWPVEPDVPIDPAQGDVARQRWRAPMDLLRPATAQNLDMPPAGPRTGDAPLNLLGPVDTRPGPHDDWVGAYEGVAALRLSSMIMAGRVEHYDARYYDTFSDLVAGAAKGGRLKSTSNLIYPLSNESVPEWRFDEITSRFGRMANLITTRSDVFEILVTVQAGNAVDTDGDNRINYRDSGEFSVTAESQGRVIYERRARTDRSDEAAK